MMALTIKQPWAQYVLQAGKFVENRDWYTGYRGVVLVHAGKARDMLDEGEYVGVRSDAPHLPHHDDLPFGAIIGAVELVDCYRLRKAKSPWEEGPWCWRLERPVVLAEPVPHRGSLSLWAPQRDALKAVAGQLKGWLR